jgi:two-component SAPR family response regulator
MDYTADTYVPIHPRVLVVEDDPTQAIILVTLIQQFGLCPIGPVSTTAEALQLHRNNRPELSIIDIGVHSIDLVAQLRRLDDLPLIFLTKHPDLPIYEHMRLVQPLIFLPKPYHLIDLQYAVNQGLSLANLKYYVSVKQKQLNECA